MSPYVISRSSRISDYIGVVTALVVVALIAMPWWGTRSQIGTMSHFLAVVALAQMWNLLTGFGGLLSIGQQAFIGLGGYMVVIFALHLGLNPYACIVIAGGVSAAVAWAASFLLFRLRGAYFGIGTWVVAELFRIIFSNTTSLGGGSGISITETMRGLDRWSRDAYSLWAALILGVGAIAVVYGLLRSSRGLAFSAVRDSEPAAESLGISITSVKLMIYLIAGAGCGMVGALDVISNLRITPDSEFSVDWTAVMFFAVVIGGIGSIEGPIIGAVLYFVLRESLAQFGGWYMILLGIVAVIVMLKAPRGLWGVVSERYDIHLFPVGYTVRPKVAQ